MKIQQNEQIPDDADDYHDQTVINTQSNENVNEPFEAEQVDDQPHRNNAYHTNSNSHQTAQFQNFNEQNEFALENGTFERPEVNYLGSKTARGEARENGEMDIMENES